MNISKTECDSPTGITVGLVDTIINSLNLLGERDLSPVDVQEAIKDLRSNPMILSLLNAQMVDAIKQAEYDPALKTAEAELQQAREKIADHEYRCDDCGLPYEDFPIDVVFPNDEWELISGNTEGGGLLCAKCIANRAGKLEGVVAINATLRRISHEI